MPNLLGSAPNQCPTNGDLGKLAFMDVVDTVTNNPYLDTAISDTKPSLLLDFANSKTLDPRITYTRASAATYYDGKSTAVAEQNLLKYSQDFDVLNKNAVVVAANTTSAPDGSMTADAVVSTTATGYHGLSNTSASLSSGITYTLSIYAKPAGYTKLYISDGSLARFACSFDLVAGTAGTPTGTYTSKSATITAANNGFYRCTLTFTTIAADNPMCSFTGYPDAGVTLDNYGAQYTGDGTSGVYLWGAQLEQRSSVSSYTPTTSQPITNYIPALQTAAAGIPRFDHDPVTGESKGFLIEEQRSNLMLQSQFASGWLTNNILITPASIIAPDGTLTGAKAVISAATASSNLFQNITLAANTTVSMSCYVKYAGVRYVNIGFAYTGGVYAGYQFDILNGVVVGGGASNGTNVSASITPVGNGWYRCVYVGSLAYANPAIAVLPSNVAYTSGNAWYSLSLTGNGFDGLYIWGAQCEAGSFATSYIPTTTSQVTRSADAASMTGANFSSWYRQDEGTVFFEGNGYQPTVVFSNVSSSSYNNYRSIYRAPGVQNQPIVVYEANAGTVSVNNLYIGNTYNASFKAAYGYKTNEFAGTVNGNNITADNLGVPALSVDRMGICFDFGPGSPSANTGIIKKLAYYPKRLSNAELQEMTQ